MDVMNAIQKSNLDIGAETVEINKVEYLVRGIGYIKNVSDLEEAVITVRNGVPVKIKDVAFVNLGPATRRGGLDKEGVEAGGGRCGSTLWIQPAGGDQQREGENLRNGSRITPEDPC